MNLIIPAGGSSSRFPGLRPKWMLVHPNGNMMVSEAIRHLNLKKITAIYLVILREHVEQYQCIDGIRKAFDNIGQEGKLHIVILEKKTRHQPETVAEAIKQEKIEGAIFIKDSDNAFACAVEPINGVAIADLNAMKYVNSPANKSYVMINEKGLISNIVEKQIISSHFCTGGYSFANSQEFLQYYEQLKDHENLYVSHIIYSMLLKGVPFQPIQVTGYEDWGTLQDWDLYKNHYSTIFIDLDGVLVENSGEYLAPLWGETSAIKENVGVINQLYESGKVRVIITTTRKETYRDSTIQQLTREGIKYHDIIFGLHHSKRIIINDYARSNPYKSCDAINIKRNSSELKEMLENSLGFNINF